MAGCRSLLKGKVRSAAVLMAAAVGLLFDVPFAAAYTPDSPEVQRMVQRAIGYLERTRSGNMSERVGCKSLIALAFYKNGAPPTHGRVAEAVQACVRLAEAKSTDARRTAGYNYDLGLAIILLCEVELESHRAAAEKLLAELHQRQKAHGGWGYRDQQTGDTSQTQYAVLALWSAYQAGLPVSQDAVERVCNWLLRTQDPSGSWGYQGVDPGVGVFQRVPQDAKKDRLSLHVAALGSVYIAADMLRLIRRPERDEKSSGPPALHLVRDQQREAEQGPVTNRVPADYLKQVLALGNQSFARRFRVDTNVWPYYYLYGLERYMSFREHVEGRSGGSAWYDQAVRWMATQQAPDGSFASPRTRNQAQEMIGAGPLVDTAFAVLFLLRSTRKSIEAVTLSDGVLTGGRGLPRDTSQVLLEDGKVVRPPIFGQVEDLLAILEDPNNPDFEDLVRYKDHLELPKENAEREIDRLAKLLRQGDYRARRLAVRSLARSGDLSNVPLLIYALTDPDPRVMLEARDGLRMLSRKFNGFGLPDRPTPEQVKQAVERWKNWYRSLRPDAEFVQ